MEARESVVRDFPNTQARSALGVSPATRLKNAMFSYRALAKGQRLYWQGDSAADVYIVLTGTLKAVRVTQRGDECVIRFYFPDELLFTDGYQTGARALSVISLEKATVCSIPFTGLQQLMRDDEGVRSQCFHLMSQSIREEHAFIVMLAHANALRRVSYFILIMINYSTKGSGALRLSMSRADIASHLGLSVETVSRSFSALQRLGFIAIEGHQLVIVDRNGLEELAAGRGPGAFGPVDGATSSGILHRMPIDNRPA